MDYKLAGIRVGGEAPSVDTLSKSFYYKVLIRQLNQLRIKKMFVEVIDNFEVEFVYDYLELSGGTWFNKWGQETEGLPTYQDIKDDLDEEVQKVISSNTMIEYRTKNNFVIFWNGESLSIDYSISGSHSGSIRKDIAVS